MSKTMKKGKTDKEIKQTKSQKIMNTVIWRAAYYRENPQRFVKDFLGIDLKFFQKVIIWAMIHNYYFMYIAARGQGKTFITAIFLCTRAILFPGSKIVIASGTRKQSNEALLKIQDEIMPKSVLLRNEILSCKIGTNEAAIYFKNGSWIRVVTSSDSSRGARANVLLLDEFRLVDLGVINTVLRKFLTSPRQPGYLKNKDYKHLVERNIEIYLSSAWMKSHWSFDKMKAYVANMLSGKNYFVCAIPYQMSIMEGLLSREQVEDEMSESDFNEMMFSIEMEALFWGDTDGAFFKYDDISSRRNIKQVFYPLNLHRTLKINIPELVNGERRTLSLDVALLASKKHNNDASAAFINRAIPNSNNNYISNIVYGETFEGLTADELGLIIMRMFYQYKCTDLVIDTNGLGVSIFDFVIRDQYDPEYGVTYNALNCCNDDSMANRCKIKNAKKVIWSIKANANSNTEMALNLRAGFQNGRINLPVSEFEAEEYIKTIKGFNKLSLQEQIRIKMAYVQTTMLVYELISLDHETKGTNIKISEKSGMRKDRYSSLEYNYWVVTQIERKKKPKKTENNYKNIFYVRPPKRSTCF